MDFPRSSGRYPADGLKRKKAGKKDQNWRWGQSGRTRCWLKPKVLLCETVLKGKNRTVGGCGTWGPGGREKVRWRKNWGGARVFSTVGCYQRGGQEWLASC